MVLERRTSVGRRLVRLGLSVLDGLLLPITRQLNAEAFYVALALGCLSTCFHKDITRPFSFLPGCPSRGFSVSGARPGPRCRLCLRLLRLPLPLSLLCLTDKAFLGFCLGLLDPVLSTCCRWGLGPSHICLADRAGTFSVPGRGPGQRGRRVSPRGRFCQGGTAPDGLRLRYSARKR